MKHLLLNINWSHAICWVIGPFWAWIEPTVPFAALCIAAVLVDCISAWRLNRRIRRKYGENAADGKLKSQHMGKMVSDLGMVFSVMLLAHGVNYWIFDGWDVPLANCVACLFIALTLVSILENESSQNDSKWAIVVQRFVIDKTKRHLNIDLSDMVKKDKKYYQDGSKSKRRKVQAEPEGECD